MAWELGAGLGHCVNIAPVAAALNKRGHQVFIVARDLGAAQTVFGGMKVEVLQAPRLPNPVAGYIAEPRTFAHLLFNNGFGDRETLRALLAGWLSIYRLVKPDVVIGEYSPTAMLAAKWTAARKGLIGTGFFAPPNISPMTDLRPWRGPIPAGTHDAEAKCLDCVNALLSAGKQQPLSALAELYSDVDHNFLTTFPELDHFLERTDGEYFGMWSPPGGRAVSWRSQEGKRAFVYIKPPRKHIDWRPTRVLQTMEKMKVETIAYAPRIEWKPEPNSSVRVSNKPVNLTKISQQCDVAILNGNAGTSTELLLRGVPQLLIPLSLEQLVFTRRVVQQRAGLLVLPSKTNLVGSALKQLLYDHAYKTAAKAFADRYSDYSPAEKIKQIVEAIDQLTQKT